MQFRDTDDPHLAAGIIKVWLCELQIPLLTYELHDTFMAAIGTRLLCPTLPHSAPLCPTLPHSAHSAPLCLPLHAMPCRTRLSSRADAQLLNVRAPLEAQSHEEQISRLIAVIGVLPPGSRLVFGEILNLLVEVCGLILTRRLLLDAYLTFAIDTSVPLQIDKQQEVNKMSSANLAIVFGPMFMRYQTTDLKLMIKMSELETKLTHKCIVHYAELFKVRTDTISLSLSLSHSHISSMINLLDVPCRLRAS